MGRTATADAASETTVGPGVALLESA